MATAAILFTTATRENTIIWVYNFPSNRHACILTESTTSFHLQSNQVKRTPKILLMNWLFQKWIASRSRNWCQIQSGISACIGVRAGGATGGCSPPKFWTTQIFGQQEKIWAKPVFKDVSMFFYYSKETNIFYFNLKKSWSQRNNPVTFSRDTHSGCLARDEFLVIGKGIICWFTYL